MSQNFHQFTWPRAATLTERLAGQASDNAAFVTAEIVEDELARYRWQSWQAQPPFDDAAFFAQRLAQDGLTEEQLRSLVAEPLAALATRFAQPQSQPQSWLNDLRAAFAQPDNGGFRQLLSDKLQRQPTTGFLNAAAPFIEQALARFDAGLAALRAENHALPFDPVTVKQLCFAHLPDALLDILNRTLALELNVARLQGELTGATPAARFQSFAEQLAQPERLQALLSEYPVLARLLSEQAQRWAAVSLEFLARLCHDWPEIKAAFAAEPGVLTGLKGGLTDTQRGGRTILIAKFSSGFRLVYKPKPLAVDAHFQELLQWLNAHGAEPRFPTLKVLARPTHGWVEFIAARACNSIDEVRRFYQRQGGYLALLYLIDATDFHSANLIACGEQPYLIDLEALFHPRRGETEITSDDPADTQASYLLGHSVLRIGLLPRRSWGNSEFAGVDRSGLGMTEGQMTPYALPHWEATGADTMHLTRRRSVVATQNNRPQLHGAPVNVLDYRAELQAGFAATYALLQTHCAELAAADGPLAAFADDEVCVFLRPSRTYRRLLSESYHPDVLRDALDRERLFDALWAGVVDDPALAAVIPTERAELWCGDTPLFTARPHSADLWLQDGARIPNFFAEPSLTTVQRRLQRLSAEDCARQQRLIHAALATMPGAEAYEPANKLVAPAPVAEVDRARLQRAAQAIGDRLAELALRGPGDASWLGLLKSQQGVWFVDSLGLDLDGGLPGVALFLAYLGARTAEPRYTALAEAALATMQRQITEWGDAMTMIGAFDGWGGVIYTLTHLGALWRRPDLLAEAEAAVERLPELIAEDTELNVYGGAAGCLVALRGLARVAPAERVTAAALQCGEHLLAQTRELPQTDFARGAAGVAWALGMLHEWTGLERFQTAQPAQLIENSVDGALLLASIEQNGWRCGTPLAVETPGLLSGLAGIGMQLLRAAEPECVPSVLLLEAPMRYGEQ